MDMKIKPPKHRPVLSRAQQAGKTRLPKEAKPFENPLGPVDKRRTHRGSHATSD